jgi:hypothetical protein
VIAALLDKPVPAGKPAADKGVASR